MKESNNRAFSMIKETQSSAETFAFAKELGQKAEGGAIYALTGDLGVGKTVFCQGFAAGLGIREYVNSPTFTILGIYEDGRLPLYHFDVYRIEEPEEMEEIGYEDYFYGDGVCLIEWAELIDELIPEGAVRVTIEKDLDKGIDYRRITVQSDARAEHT